MQIEKDKKEKLMSTIADKNKASWNAYAEKYTNYEHSDKQMSEFIKELFKKFFI